MNEIRAFVKQNRWTVCCTAAGVLCAALLLTIGFWRTLLLCLLAGCGYMVGRELDKRGPGRIRALARRVYGKYFKGKRRMSRSMAREVAMKLAYSRLMGGEDTPDAVQEKSAFPSR